MARFLLSLGIALLLLLLLGCAGAASCSQVSQFGITWAFDKSYECGQFANGDYWVVGPVTITGITPASVESGGRMINGSMINPSPANGKVQGYDSMLYANYTVPSDYSPALNAARPNNQPVSPSNRLVVQPGSSLVSTISTPLSYDATGARLQTAAILTVLGAAAPAGSFRPAYTNVSKAIRFNKSQLNYSLLSRLAPVAGMPRLKQLPGDSQAASVERMFERPWIDHVPDWPGRALHPVENMPDYGRELANEVSIAALMLHLDLSNEEKETLLIRFVQFGIDSFGVVQDNGLGNWPCNGGHASGRKWPILFAGLVLNDAGMKGIGAKSGDYLYSGSYGPENAPADYIHFGEDDQTFFVSQLEVDATHTPAWSPDPRAPGDPYSVSDIGLPEWGINHASTLNHDNKNWLAAYRQCCNALAWPGFVLAAHIMDAKQLWKHDALFDYQDRYMEVEDSWRCNSSFVENMWDTYREDYGCVWVRDNPANVYSQGHYEGCGTACSQNSDCSTGRVCCSGSCVLPVCIANSNCIDGNAATSDVCSGAGTCAAACTHSPITACVHNDGYCPPGCTSLNDGDCAVACGNGVADSGETCSSCPADVHCSAGQVCQAGECIAQQECVNMQALMNYISQWKSGGIAMQVLMQKIVQWKAGTEC